MCYKKTDSQYKLRINSKEEKNQGTKDFYGPLPWSTFYAKISNGTFFFKIAFIMILQ